MAASEKQVSYILSLLNQKGILNSAGHADKHFKSAGIPRHKRRGGNVKQWVSALDKTEAGQLIDVLK